jgi:hypothetical protein
MKSIAKTIQDEMTSWPGVTAHPHQFGAIEYRIGHREIGHVHGSRFVDIPFPTRIRNELVTSGRASPHHVMPNTGWVTFYIRSSDDVPAALELLRLNYERLARLGKAKDTTPSGKPEMDPLVEKEGANL